MDNNVFSQPQQGSIATCLVEFFGRVNGLGENLETQADLEPYWKSAREEKKDVLSKLFVEFTIQLHHGDLGFEKDEVMEAAFLIKQLHELIDRLGSRDILEASVKYAESKAATLKAA